MIVRDAAKVVERALRPLRQIADEVCYVDTGSTDGTPDAIDDVCADLGIHSRGMVLSPDDRPDLYFWDRQDAYYPHTFRELTEAPLLRDWSAARNLGLETCRGQYVLKLDADDEVLTPQAILGLMDHLDEHPQIDLVACPYEIMDGHGSTEYVTMYTRLWRNKPEIRFREVCHDNVDWCRRPDGSNWTMTNEVMHVRDWRDNVGTSRVPRRNLKTLLREYLHCKTFGRLPSPHVLIYLADEAAETRPTLALAVLDDIPHQLSQADESWKLFIRGRAYETMGLFTDAGWYYRRATSHNWQRAMLRNALMLARRGEDDPNQLATAIVCNEGKCYPRHASMVEIAEARKILDERK